MSNKTFQELNLNNGFLFPAALEDPVTCRLVLECILGELVSDLTVKVEYTKPYNSEFKCIRLDVYAKAVAEVSYNLEMQNRNEYNLPLRSRYYQAQIDVASLEPGDDYNDLKPLYVIFICNFDPFGLGLYRYTFSMHCEERDLPLNDGVKRIFFSTKGKNEDEVSGVLTDFLGYLNDSTDSYVEGSPNEKLREIHNRITELKKKRDVEARYMHYLYVDKLIEAKEKALEEAEKALKETKDALKEKDDTLKEAQKADRDMIMELIEDFAEMPEGLHRRIEEEKDTKNLKLMLRAAMRADSLEQFEEKIADLL
mgnify:CR=1 FL=1